MKRSGLILILLLAFSAYLPVVSAKDKTAEVRSVLSNSKAGEDSLGNLPGKEKNSGISFLYSELQLGQMGLSRQAFEYAMKGFEYLKQNGGIDNDAVISIVDFSLPSSAKRLFVIDLNNNKILYCTYVAHGHNSGLEYASRFSNKPESNKSSLGFYKTLGTYNGDNGYSLRLEGLEKGINDNANRRDIVIHGAAYVSEGLIRAQGYIGRSQGCPALPEKLHKPIIDKIKNGTCLFIYGKDKNYRNRSRILKAVG